MSNTATNEQASKSESSDTSSQERASVDNTDLNLVRRKPDKQSLLSAINQKIRSKLSSLGDPLKRFLKSKRYPNNVNSEVENVDDDRHEPRSLGFEKIDEYYANPSTSTQNEELTKINPSVYRSEHHLVANDARTRESYQDLASYFSELDPDEPSTSATNTTVLSASTFDRDVERTEPSENLQSTTVTSTTSSSFGNDITETVSSSMNTDDVSDTDFVDLVQHATIIAMNPMAVSVQLGNEIRSMSETMDSRTRDQGVGRDDPSRELYERTLRMVIRKPLCPQEDEPNIY
ncbi:uncharacterized protein LOC109856341 isoform X2 [Pseudomyrmex gracilis]|uniref:uncharacterized protein LOC109856341 isoform X2 n=1 Tax=Pseudomyrmex gracilis TaxID=219809 RepID=UPI000995B0DD|nr:uncharacterized protein LOC109856341 isoform X2 [Pseudomyrmex gracilis]